jgi:thiol-disulfide isomerase/thioredoxin
MAAVAGSGAHWFWDQSVDEPESMPLWRMQWPTPDGGSLAMKSFAGKPVLVNFWATWCPPCIAELPLIERFYQENKAKNWQVLGIAVDRTEAVQPFLQQNPLSFPQAMAGMQGVELSRSLGNLSGALPFTVVFNATKVVVHRKMGTITENELQLISK